MSKHRNDISQVKKYLGGKLDGPAMHKLERRGLDDPFLGDALEGYEVAGKDQQNNLADLSSRLQNRIDKKERRIIPWAQLSAKPAALTAPRCQIPITQTFFRDCALMGCLQTS